MPRKPRLDVPGALHHIMVRGNRDTHKSGLLIPDVGRQIGFDLVEYDWVSPYGTGKQADFIFKLDNRFVNERDFETVVTITFTHKFDGLQPAKDESSGGVSLNCRGSLRHPAINKN